MRRLFWLPAFGLVLGIVGGLGGLGQVGWTAAQAPPEGVAPASTPAPGQAPADPNQEYAITPQAGPWVICAASYVGPDAPELARQLVVQLRERHNLPAYIFNYGAAERQKLQQDDLERIRRMNPEIHLPRRTVRIQEQCAVLVGGFRDLDQAGAALKNIKKLPLPELKLDSGRSAYDYENLVEPDPAARRMRVSRRPVNPLANSFVVRNPTVPQEKQTNKPDPFWKQLNADEEYSLLKCRKPWTLAVKEYTGAAVVQPRSGSSSFLKMIGLGGRTGEALGAAGLQAHELARFLRAPQLGFEAYVLHTRNKSVVTVGAFDGPNDPELLRAQQRLMSLRFMRGAQPGTQPATAQAGPADPIGLFAPPMPMQVPQF